MTFSEYIYTQVPSWVQTLLLNAHALRVWRHRYGYPFRAVVARLGEQERWPRERLREYQNLRIREIVKVAYYKSPYYRHLMDTQRIRPSDIQGVADLTRFPLLDKHIVRTRPCDLMTASKPYVSWLKGHTSGTTGSPLDIWYDRDLCIFNNAVDQRQKLWGGMTFDDWIGLFLGRVIVPTDQTRGPFWRVNRIHRQIWFSSFHLSEENLAQYVTEIERRRLQFLEGYPSTLYILANYLIRQNQTLPMRAVFTSSETLHDLQREKIEKAFKCQIFDFYGLAERVLFATECEAHAGKHIAEEYGYTEIVDDEGTPVPAGCAGYLVGTSLHNTAMPMIRYRIGDISSLITDLCECGRTSIRLSNVTTKAEDFVVTPDGRIISPSVLTHPFKPFHQLIKSQIVQNDPYHILVKLVRSDEFTSAHEAELVAGLQSRLGKSMEIAVKFVDDIPREASGKYRWVISSVDHVYQVPWAPENQT